ncbi:hypothetical protein FI667_g1679, partial [Globisporangium splendens]
MEQWADEVNFDDRGAFIDLAAAAKCAAVNAPSARGSHGEHDSSDVDGDARSTHVATARTPDNHIVNSQWPVTLTPNATQDPHQHAQQAALVPCFETYLGVSPAFIFQFARTRTEATLLYDVTCIAMEMDVLLDYISEQLHDRYGSKSVEDSIKRRLMSSIEANVGIADDLEDHGDTDGAATRRKLAQVQVALLERLQSLQNGDAIPLTSKLVVPSESQQTRTNVCWPVASNSDESSSSGSTHTSFSLASPNQERRRLMEVEDLDITRSLDRHGDAVDKQHRGNGKDGESQHERPQNHDEGRTKDRFDGQRRDSLELSSQYGGHHVADAQRERGLSEETSSSNEHIYSESVY